jgi:isopenicillin-N N-acyltransferase-like protein
MPQMERYNAVFVEEIRAIAEGAELPVESIVAINARTELLYGQKPQVANKADDDPDGCTGAMAMPEATASGHTLHGQNWDWRDECAESSVVLKIRPATGPDMLIFVEAGILARCGLNSAGVAVTGNFLQTDDDHGKPGVPAPLIRRAILSSPSLAEAVKVVFQAPRAFSNNLMISQSDGECVNLEGTPSEVFWLQAERGLLVHANHFQSPGALAKVRDIGLETNVDSLYRQRRVQAHLAERAGSIQPTDLMTAFADRYGSPRAVCRSPVTGPGGKTSSTVATVVMDTTARKMWVAKQPYDDHYYREYALD